MEKVSYIQNRNGQQRLYIHGECQEGLAYITYLTDRNRYADFAKAGYRLFSVPVFFGFNHLNEYSKLDVFTKGIFDNEESDFSVFDEDIRRILKVRPDAYIFPRVNVSLSRNWELAHPDELCDPYPDGTLHRASFASDIWAEEVRRELTLYIRHVQESDYADRIVGYQIAGGNTEEWLPLDEKKGISGKRMEEAYRRYLQESGEVDGSAAYYRLYSRIVTDRIMELAALTKELTERRVIVGTFYGYTMEFSNRRSGHNALGRLLECEDIDFLCSPVTYAQTRAAGRDHGYMIPLASVKLHGKLYFAENDTRTHLSRPVCDMPWYTAPIWWGPDKAATMEIIKMHAARALVKQHAAWWFDMWGGWFADEDYMTLLKQIRELFARSQGLPTGSAAQVAVFVDEDAYVNVAEGVDSWYVYHLREPLGKMGVPYDLYLAADAPAVMDKYDAVISLKAAESPNNTRVAELAGGKPYLELTYERRDITAEQLRAFLKEAGVHLWCDGDSVVYANESFVFLHTAEEGAAPLRTPDGRQLRDVFTGEFFRGDVPRGKGESYILEYV